MSFHAFWEFSFTTLFGVCIWKCSETFGGPSGPLNVGPQKKLDGLPYPEMPKWRGWGYIVGLSKRLGLGNEVKLFFFCTSNQLVLYQQMNRMMQILQNLNFQHGLWPVCYNGQIGALDWILRLAQARYQQAQQTWLGSKTRIACNWDTPRFSGNASSSQAWIVLKSVVTSEVWMPRVCNSSLLTLDVNLMRSAFIFRT